MRRNHIQNFSIYFSCLELTNGGFSLCPFCSSPVSRALLKIVILGFADVLAHHHHHHLPSHLSKVSRPASLSPKTRPFFFLNRKTFACVHSCKDGGRLTLMVFVSDNGLGGGGRWLGGQLCATGTMMTGHKGRLWLRGPGLLSACPPACAVKGKSAA